MTARAKGVLLGIIIVILLVVVLVFGSIRDTDEVSETSTSTSPVVTENPQQDTEDVTDYFREEMQSRFVAEVGQPIEGFEPSMFMDVYPALVALDFNGVEASQGMYSVENGELVFEQTKTPEHSAARAITEEGMETLLRNITERLELPYETEADIDALLLVLQEQASA